MTMYSYSVRNTINQLLPSSLRHTKMMAWLYALCTPYQNLKNELDSFRPQTTYKITHTGQVILLEKVLNDNFDKTQRRIKIGRGNPPIPLFFYTESAQRPVNFNTVAFSSNNNTTEQYDFKITVPFVMTENEKKRLKTITDFYKLPEKKYKLITL